MGEDGERERGGGLLRFAASAVLLWVCEFGIKMQLDVPTVKHSAA
jgi:hypothetical protein